MFWTVLSIVCGAVVLVILGALLWLRWMLAGLRKVANDPHNQPALSWSETPPARLRSQPFREALEHLETLGFRELGTLVEKVGMRTTHSRQLTHADGTTVSVASFARKPTHTFLSELRGQITMVETTSVPIKTKKHGTLLTGGSKGTVDEQLAAHRALLKEAERDYGPLEPVLCETGEQRKALTRRYYIERYTHEGTLFRPFENPVRLELP